MRAPFGQLVSADHEWLMTKQQKTNQVVAAAHQIAPARMLGPGCAPSFSAVCVGGVMCHVRDMINKKSNQEDDVGVPLVLFCDQSIYFAPSSTRDTSWYVRLCFGACRARVGDDGASGAMVFAPSSWSPCPTADGG